MTDVAWRRLGELVKRRREELGLTQAQIQDHGGPSPASLRKLENGRMSAMAGSNRRSLERALGWQLGNIDDILDGENPTLATEALEIPNLTRTTTPEGKTRYEVENLGDFDALKLYGAAIAADTLAGVADDLQAGEGSQEHVIAWAHTTHRRVMELLADVMRTDVRQAEIAARRLRYAFNNIPDDADKPRT